MLFFEPLDVALVSLPSCFAKAVLKRILVPVINIYYALERHILVVVAGVPFWELNGDQKTEVPEVCKC